MDNPSLPTEQCDAEAAVAQDSKPTSFRVDPTCCEAYGFCMEEAPDLFDVDDWGYAQIRSKSVVPPERIDAARRAVRACPVKAIREISSALTGTQKQV